MALAMDLATAIEIIVCPSISKFTFEWSELFIT